MTRHGRRGIRGALLSLCSACLLTLLVLMVPPGWHSGGSEPAASDLDKIVRRCQIVRDKHEIPHIRAKTLEAASYCWGRVHALDRGWQMDFLRRAAYGRLAEAYGLNYVRQDFMVRLLDLHRHAERWAKTLQRLSPGIHRSMQFYALGINSVMQGRELHDRSYQVRATGVSIAPWRIQDSLAIALLQSFFQTRKTFTDDLAHAQLRARLKPTHYQRLFADQARQQAETTIIKADELMPTSARGPVNHAPGPASLATPGRHEGSAMGARAYAQALAVLRSDPATDFGTGGSNSWVVAKSRSKSGHAMLANDPHLVITNPSFWHESHVTVRAGDAEPELDVTGLTVAGLPAIMVGHNRHVAWGITNGYSNAADIVRIEPDADGWFSLGKKRYRIATYRPLVRFKLGPLYVPVFWKSFERTPIGPILPVELPGGGKLLLRWTGFHLEEAAIGAMMGLQRARDVTEADRALKRFTLPCWNFVFADDRGDVGYRQVGLVARRTGGQRGVLEPLSAGHAWNGFLSAAEMPALLRPKRGFIATANNRPVPASFPFFLGHAFAVPDRAARIELLLSRRDHLTLAQLKKIQLDVELPFARLLLPHMLDLVSRVRLSGVQRRILGRLRNWDYQAHGGSIETTIFVTWYHHMLRRLAGHPKLTAELGEPAQATPRVLRSVFALAKEKSALPELLDAALTDTLAQLERDLGSNVGRWHWSRYHTVELRSLLGEHDWQPPAQGIAGGSRSVNVAPHQGSGPFRVRYAASYRLLVELGPRLSSWGALAGKPIDRAPKELHPEQLRWVQQRYRRRAFYPDEVAKLARDTTNVRF